MGKELDSSLPKYPSDKCLSSDSGSHYFVRVLNEIFRCKHCGAAKWQPSIYADAYDFSSSIMYVGIERAYAKELELRPRLAKVVKAIEDDFKLRHNVPDEVANIAMKALHKGVIRKSPRRRSRAKALEGRTPRRKYDYRD